MVVIFLADNETFKAVDPTQLQLRQMSPGKVGLGIPQAMNPQVEGEEPKVVFLPFITFNTDLAQPVVPPQESK